MRKTARWAALGAISLAFNFVACGGDDDAPGSDAGSDARDAGKGGTAGSGGGKGGSAGSDAGRDSAAGTGGTGGTAGSGGAAGTSGAAGNAGSAGKGGSAGTGGASTDAGNDGREGGANDAPIDGAPLDTSVDAVDSSADAAGDGDVAVSDTAPDGSDVAADVHDGGADAEDAQSDADAASSDANDGAVADATDAADAPSCNDGNAASFDFYNPPYGCGHRFDANPNDNAAWITYDAGFYVDVATGLGWVMPAGSRNAIDAALACASHNVAGLSDWRIPTITEARTIAGGCAPTVPGGTCPIADPGCLDSNCGQGSLCNSCTGGQGPNAGSYCAVDVPICSHFHTSSLCTDCGDATVMDWMYSPSNGHFLPFNALSSIPTACVSAVPNGVPPNDGG